MHLSNWRRIHLLSRLKHLAGLVVWLLLAKLLQRGLLSSEGLDLHLPHLLLFLLLKRGRILLKSVRVLVKHRIYLVELSHLLRWRPLLLLLLLHNEVLVLLLKLFMLQEFTELGFKHRVNSWIVAFTDVERAIRLVHERLIKTSGVRLTWALLSGPFSA